MKTVVILQSSYIPWKGHFDLMHDADLFIFYDDVQYTHSDWRTRNRIQTPRGPAWLTIPAGRDLTRRICDVEVGDQTWKRKHRRSIEQNYHRAPYFREHLGLLDFLYDNDLTNLSAYNQRAARHIAGLLGIRTEFVDSREFDAAGQKTERLIGILRQAGATRYVSGPSARDYLDERQFHEAGIILEYKDYAGYPTYPQCFEPFEHGVSIIDVLFNTGPRAADYVWGWRRGAFPA